jgi:hypothetical protein
MVLKKAYGPALLAALSIVPTFMFGNVCKEKFLRCYQDAGLLQTNQLDCWGESQPRSSADREKFRQWLVDCKCSLEIRSKIPQKIRRLTHFLHFYRSQGKLCSNMFGWRGQFLDGRTSCNFVNRRTKSYNFGKHRFRSPKDKHNGQHIRKYGHGFWSFTDKYNGQRVFFSPVES